MPDNPNTWTDLLSRIPAEMWEGGIMAVVISTLRVIYDKEETKPIRIVMEAVICGLLAMTAHYGIAALGFDTSNWTPFIGGVIGYLGSASVRSLALKLLNKKVEK